MIISIAAWLTVTCTMAAVLAMLLAHTPHRLRLIGLFAGLQGGLCGWLAMRAGVRLKMRFPLLAMPGSACIAAGSVALTTGLWWQAHAALLTTNYRPPAGAAMAAAILEADQSADPETRQELERFRSSLLSAGAMPPDTGFAAYLNHRSSAVTDSRFAGPWLFGLELLLAGVLAGWLAGSGTKQPFCETCGNWILPIRRQEFSGDAAGKVASLAGIESGLWTRAVVSLTHCQCPEQPPEALILLESPAKTESIEICSTDRETGDWTAQRLGELNRQIDAAQGLR
ncbi:MAG: hypothetical protein VB858_18295 [Planctomycetaceae bacterium]